MVESSKYPYPAKTTAELVHPPVLLAAFSSPSSSKYIEQRLARRGRRAVIAEQTEFLEVVLDGDGGRALCSYARELLGVTIVVGHEALGILQDEPNTPAVRLDNDDPGLGAAIWHPSGDSVSLTDMESGPVWSVFGLFEGSARDGEQRPQSSCKSVHLLFQVGLPVRRDRF